MKQIQANQLLPRVHRRTLKLDHTGFIINDIVHIVKYVNGRIDYDRSYSLEGPLTRYVKLRVAHAPGMPGNVFPATDFNGNC